MLGVDKTTKRRYDKVYLRRRILAWGQRQHRIAIVWLVVSECIHVRCRRSVLSVISLPVDEGNSISVCIHRYC